MHALMPVLRMESQGNHLPKSGSDCDVSGPNIWSAEPCMALAWTRGDAGLAQGSLRIHTGLTGTW